MCVVHGGVPHSAPHERQQAHLRPPLRSAVGVWEAAAAHSEKRSRSTTLATAPERTMYIVSASWPCSNSTTPRL